jgi:hypothetical protein
MNPTSILYDFEPAAFVELCHDPKGARFELIEITGIRQRDVDELLDALQPRIAERFVERPDWRRIVVWSQAGWLAAHDADEYITVRDWLDDGLRELQSPWRLPMTGQVGCAVLQDALPQPLLALRIGSVLDLDYERERDPERRSTRRR